MKKTAPTSPLSRVLSISSLAAGLLLTAGSLGIVRAQQPPPTAPAPAAAVSPQSDPAHPDGPPFPPGGALAWLQELRDGPDGVNAFRGLRAIQQGMIMDRAPAEEMFGLLLGFAQKQEAGNGPAEFDKSIVGIGLATTAFRLSQLDPKKALEMMQKSGVNAGRDIILANMAESDLPGALAAMTSLPAEEQDQALTAIMEGASAKPREIFEKLKGFPGHEYDGARAAVIAELAADEPQLALDAAEASVTNGQDPHILAEVMRTNLDLEEKILGWAETYAGNDHEKILSAAFDGVARQNPKLAATHFRTLAGKMTAEQKEAAYTSLGMGMTSNSDATEDALAALEPGEMRTTATKHLIGTLQTMYPETAYKWAKTLPEGPDRKKVLAEVMKSWMQSDPDEARAAQKADSAEARGKGKK